MYYQNSIVSSREITKTELKMALKANIMKMSPLKQKGEFINGKENGIWNMYFQTDN